MKIIINIQDNNATKTVLQNMEYILDSTQETGHCLIVFKDKYKTNVFIAETKTGYKITAYCK